MARPTDGEAWDAMCDAFGLDEFQRIAVAEISRDLDRVDPTGNAIPEPDSEHERLLTRLGAVILGA